MSNPLDLQTVDADGAIRELADQAGFGRADFLRRGALAGGGILAGGVLAGEFLGTAEAKISSRRSVANDVKILNFALTLEFLEAAFYKQAVANNAFSNDLYRRFGQVVADHEATHVAFLKKTLGSKAIKEPKFDFKDTVTDPAKFAATAQVLEDTGVGAYLGQTTRIKQAPVLKAAGTIVTVEARHASWIRVLNGGGASTAPEGLPAPASFDKPKTEAQVLSAVGKTGFITG